MDFVLLPRIQYLIVLRYVLSQLFPVALNNRPATNTTSACALYCLVLLQIVRSVCFVMVMGGV
jgi:hypothetical protein